MAASAYSFTATALKIDLEERPEEITIRCNGRITAESAPMLEREVCDYAIPMSRGKGVAATNRIVLDLSNVTHIDNAGLEVLLGIWTAGQRKSCNVEVINSGSPTFRRALLNKLDLAFNRMLALFD